MGVRRLVVANGPNIFQMLLVQMINYLFDELHVSYVQTGKFQTLEFRFSQYRQLSIRQDIGDRKFVLPKSG